MLTTCPGRAPSPMAERASPLPFKPVSRSDLRIDHRGSPLVPGLSSDNVLHNLPLGSSPMPGPNDSRAESPVVTTSAMFAAASPPRRVNRTVMPMAHRVSYSEWLEGKVAPPLPVVAQVPVHCVCGCVYIIHHHK